jgi:ketosteroid isomerase-like protein
MMGEVITAVAARALVRAYFAAVTAGELPDALLTEDMVGWTTHRGTMSRAEYKSLIPVLARICRVPLQFTIDAITVEDDRAVAEARSVGTLINGEEYRQTYVFAFRFRDDRISSIAEHYNALIVEAKLMPLLRG